MNGSTILQEMVANEANTNTYSWQGDWSHDWSGDWPHESWSNDSWSK